MVLCWVWIFHKACDISTVSHLYISCADDITHEVHPTHLFWTKPAQKDKWCHTTSRPWQVSVAKAGLISTLNARTSVCACANPIGSRYNPALSVSENINLPPTLLTRCVLLLPCCTCGN